ncbi:hypothetical protein DPMN_037854 [Dreissena polymorpha]|uniref:Uncharacterized protein n=1 Tax=Dreissena polymorpha TaxID=45954 RepID=A0A9D4RMP0_DREPO|nr:hypothetical protein DPMN_037854 [Dreissena polymorpha]
MFGSPILMYGLEIVLPNQGLLYKLELAQKRLIKQLFIMLHINTPDVAIYLLSGLLPTEAMIHKSAIVTFNSVCQKDDAIERRLAIRQVNVKVGL